MSGPRATKCPKLNRLLKIVNYFTCICLCGTCFVDSGDPQKLIWIDTQGSVTHITKVLKFTNQSGPRPYFRTKNKWPQKHILYQFSHCFLTHLKPQMESKATKHMYKSWENLPIGPPLILKFWPLSPLATWVIHCPYGPGISAPLQDDQHERVPSWAWCLPTHNLLCEY